MDNKQLTKEEVIQHVLHLRQQASTFYAKHADEIKERAREYYFQHREEILERYRKQREAFAQFKKELIQKGEIPKRKPRAKKELTPEERERKRQYHKDYYNRKKLEKQSQSSSDDAPNT